MVSKETRSIAMRPDRYMAGEGDCNSSCLFASLFAHQSICLSICTSFFCLMLSVVECDHFCCGCVGAVGEKKILFLCVVVISVLLLEWMVMM